MNTYSAETKSGFILPVWRQWAAVGVILLSLVVIFCGLEFAQLWVQKSVYYFSTVAMLGFVTYLYRWVRRGGWHLVPPTQVCIVGGVTVLLTSVFLLVHANFNLGLMPREYVDASVARNLHEYREAFVTEAGVVRAKQFVPTETTAVNHMWLYSYSVAWVHDIFGYRASAPVMLNVLLLPIFLGTFYYFVWRMAGALVAALGLLLWLTLPLFLLSATGGSSGLLSLSLLMFLIVILGAYLREPMVETEGALVFGLILLSYAHLSALCFIIPVMFVICWGRRRSGGPILSLGLVVLPAMYVPVVLQAVNRLSHDDVSWAWTSSIWQNLSESVSYALNFFYSYDGSHPNSLLLSAFGIIGFVALPFLLRRELKWYIATGRHELVGLLVLSPFILLQLLIVLGVAGRHVDEIESAFTTLNLHLLLIVVILLNLVYIKTRLPGVYRYFLMIACLYIVGFTLPSASKTIYMSRSDQVLEQQWLESVSQHLLKQSSLVIDSNGVPWALREWTSVTPDLALTSMAQIARDVASGRFRAVYMIEHLVYTDAGEFIALGAEGEFLKNMDTLVVAERSFRPFTLTRVSRLVAYHSDDAVHMPELGDEPSNK
jgi:hypothetical protein